MIKNKNKMEETRKLKQPTDLFRTMMLDKAKQYGGSRQYALQQAYIDLLEEDLQNDTFKDITMNQMNNTYDILLRAVKDKLHIPKLKLITKYGKDNHKIHHYQCNDGVQYLVCNIGILYFSKNNWEKFKDSISIYNIQGITKKTFRYTNERLDLNDMERHLFYQLYHNHNANYEYDGGKKINWKSIKGIKFGRAQIADLPMNRPMDMMM